MKTLLLLRSPYNDEDHDDLSLHVASELQKQLKSLNEDTQLLSGNISQSIGEMYRYEYSDLAYREQFYKSLIEADLVLDIRGLSHSAKEQVVLILSPSQINFKSKKLLKLLNERDPSHQYGIRTSREPNFNLQEAEKMGKSAMRIEFSSTLTLDSLKLIANNLSFALLEIYLV